MKKLLLISLCVPLIGFGQIVTVDCSLLDVTDIVIDNTNMTKEEQFEKVLEAYENAILN